MLTHVKGVSYPIGIDLPGSNPHEFFRLGQSGVHGLAFNEVPRTVAAKKQTLWKWLHLARSQLKQTHIYI